MTKITFDDHPPDLPHVTPYDERHLKTYLRLLDADEEGADWREDAEAAAATVEHALGLAASLVIRHVRAVPEACPACGSNRLSPQRGVHSSVPDVEWERPTCEKCGWVGEPVPILGDPDAYIAEEEDRPPPEGECVIPTIPLRELRKPDDRKE